MKEILKTGLSRLVLLLLIIGFMTHFSAGEVCAAEFDNAVDFYKDNGAAVVYNNGYFYYGTRGATSSSSVRYRTVGFKFKVSNAGGNASVRFKTGGTGVRFVHGDDANGYNYNLYKIQVRDLKGKLSATNTNVHSAFGTSTNTILVDSLMVVVINGVPQGTLADNGNTSSGTVYDTYAGIMGAQPWGTPPEKASYFDKPIVYRNILDTTAPSGYFTPNNASWTNGNVSPKFTPTDNTGGSGVDRWRYRKYTNGSWGSWSGWNWSVASGFGTLAQGTHRFQVEVRDKAGNVGTVTSGYYYIDKTTPTVTANPSSRGWGNTNVTVKLTYKDTGGSGLNIQQCKWSTSTARPTSWANYSSYPNGVSTGTAGTSYLHYRVSDKAGNIRYGYFGPYRIDKVAPTHQNHSLTGYDYKNGNDYWVKPNTQVSIRMRGYEALSGMRYNYIRLLGTNADARSHHDWTDIVNRNNNSQFSPSPRISIDSASRTYNSGNNKEITWKVTPKNYSDIYNIQYYYRDNASNIVGYKNTGMKLGVDNAAPNITITQNPTTWTNKDVDITAIAKDNQSGVKDLVLIDGPIDGSNLAVNTNSRGWSIYNKNVYTDAELTFREDGSTTIVKAKNTGTSNRMAVQQLDKELYLKTGETYTLSFEVRGNINKLDYNHLMNEITPNQGIEIIDLSGVKDNEWVKVSTTFTKATGHSPKTSVMIGVREPKIGDWFEFKNVKVEKGSTATDWEPSNRDSLAGDGKNLVLKSNTPANSTEYRVTGYDMSTDWEG